MSTSWLIILRILVEFPPSLTRPRPHISRNSFFQEISVGCHFLFCVGYINNWHTTSTHLHFLFSDLTFLIWLFQQLYSMANYSRASGEAQASNFVTLSSQEFYSNQRESFRLCVSAVKGTPKLNLTKFWFNSEHEKWLPTGKNFYFSKEAWGSLFNQINSLNSEIQKKGLFGMRFHFS